MQKRTHCLLCHTPLPDMPVVHFENLPYGVQNLLTAEDLVRDSGAELQAYQCIGCGHIQLNSLPVVYHQGVTSTTAFSKTMLEWRLNQLRWLVGEYALREKRILDVGCGDGQTMGLIAEAGSQPVGIDASEKALAVARDHGYVAHFGYLTRHHRIADAPYDGFVCYDVIEHVPDIQDFMQGIAANMGQGAIGLIETPNFDKVIENSRFYDFMLDHLSYFTPDTLRISAEIGGFEVLHLEKNRDEENLTMIVRKRKLVDFQPMRQQVHSLSDELSDYLRQHQVAGRRVAIWGASLQTLTLAAITELAVVYVIDSAPYKQGRYTPVSHLRIVAPDVLRQDPVDVVVVNAPRYQDEILQTLRDDIGFRGEIAILDGQAVRVT